MRIQYKFCTVYKQHFGVKIELSLQKTAKTHLGDNLRYFSTGSF